jgi:hypothetical protein
MKMPPVSCYLLLLSPNYLLLLSNTLSLCSSLNNTWSSSTPKYIKHHTKLQFCILQSHIPRHHTGRPKILYQILWDSKGKENRQCKHTVTIMHIRTGAATSEFESWDNQCQETVVTYGKHVLDIKWLFDETLQNFDATFVFQHSASY